MEAHLSLFGDSVNLDERQVHGLRQMHYRLRNHFGCIRWYSDVTWVKWILVSIHLEIVLILRQDSCTVCVEHTIGSEIILDTPDEPLGDLGHVESCIFLWRQC